MSVYKDRKTGRWFVDIGHKQLRHRCKSPENTRTGAVAYEALLRRKLVRGEPLVEKKSKKEWKPFFRDFAWEWFNIYVKNNNKPSEIRGKKFTLRTHLVPFFGKSRVDKISNLDIERYKAKKIKEGLSNKTINNHLSALNKSLHTAEEWLDLDKIPKIKKLNVPPQKFDYLTIEESEILLKHANGMWHNMILTALKTGMRLGELRGLKWDDIDIVKQRLTVRRSVYRHNCFVTPKSNKERIIPLSDTLYLALKSRQNKNGFVFSEMAGTNLRNMNCYRKLRKICQAAGLRKIGWHVMRHTFASHLIMAGAHLKAVQELLGHSDIRTTMRYAHMTPSALCETVKLLDKNEKIGNLRQHNGSKRKKFTEIMELISPAQHGLLPNIKQKQEPKLLLMS